MAWILYFICLPAHRSLPLVCNIAAAAAAAAAAASIAYARLDSNKQTTITMAN